MGMFLIAVILSGMFLGSPQLQASGGVATEPIPEDTTGTGDIAVNPELTEFPVVMTSITMINIILR
jgi:hypothetical protein